jgi:hypothetical protein
MAVLAKASSNYCSAPETINNEDGNYDVRRNVIKPWNKAGKSSNFDADYSRKQKPHILIEENGFGNVYYNEVCTYSKCIIYYFTRFIGYCINLLQVYICIHDTSCRLKCAYLKPIVKSV